MKLSEWAIHKGISYMTAWRMWKTGKLPVPAEQLPTGILLRFFNAKDSSDA
ncbi:MAG: IS607 family transposase, partial [Thermodesulforhabdaceae bacterium]